MSCHAWSATGPGSRPQSDPPDSALWPSSKRDRSVERVENFADGSTRDAYVAGVAGLICAKAYKLAERVAAREAGRRDRVLAKDAGDLWRLLAVSHGRTVREVFDAHTDGSPSGQAIGIGGEYLSRLLRGDDLPALASRQFANEVAPDALDDVIDTWAGDFGP